MDRNRRANDRILARGIIDATDLVADPVEGPLYCDLGIFFDDELFVGDRESDERMTSTHHFGGWAPSRSLVSTFS